jgi:hypothetical protein
MTLGLLGAGGTGCELMVQLDRGAVDAGSDAPCPICSDAAEESDDTGLGPESSEAGPDAGDAAVDAGPGG